MKPIARVVGSLLTSFLLVEVFVPKLVQGQPIQAATDGTGTLVTSDGNRFDIYGGTLSSDRTNLFQSFERFGLSPGQTANFVSNPEIRNILGRVVGGEPSIINGLIQVTGGNSNLFLMNPAGIVFGTGARLNVSADFSATTANGIGFGTGWFNASGETNYADLVGTPSTFGFTMMHPGGIMNMGELAVKPGQNLALLGGTVVSSGALDAPGGQLLVSAVPGESMLRLSQPGHVLSLEVPKPTDWTLPVLSLPQLLTSGGAGNATGVTLNSNGTVRLTGSGISVADGDVVARSVTAQQATLSADRNLTLVESQLNTTGDLYTYGGVTTSGNVSLNSTFGAITIQSVNASASNSSNNSNGGQVSISARGDITVTTGIGTDDGNPGNITLTSSAGSINTSTGVLSATSNGNGNGGAIALSAPNGSLTVGKIDTKSRIGNGGSINLSAAGNITATGSVSSGLLGGVQNAGDGTAGDITFNAGGDITTSDVQAAVYVGVRGNGGNIRLTSAGNINSYYIDASNYGDSGNAGSITINSGETIKNDGYIRAAAVLSPNGNGGKIDLSAVGKITTEFIESASLRSGKGGAITATAGGDITTTYQQDSLKSSINSSGALGGGDITLTSTAGAINTTTGSVNSSSLSGSGGAISLSAQGNINTGNLFSFSQATNAGNIALSANGNITSGIVQASGNNTGGDITLQTAGNITTNSILSAGGNGNGGTINLNSGGAINITNDSTTNQSGISSLSGSANGGNITLNAASNINTGSRPLFSSSAIGNGGNITVRTTNGDIQVAGIEAEGGTGGTGGTVDITSTNFFRAIGSFPNQNGTTASISTSGGTGGGSIIIHHGGRGITPFIVGDASTNGTAGAITTGNLFPVQTISPTASFLYTHTQNGIQIISIPEQTLPPPPPPPPSQIPQDTPRSPQDTLAFLVGDLVGGRTSVNLDPLSGSSGYSWSWTIPGQGSLDTGYINLQNALAQDNLNQAVSQIDESFEQELEKYLGEKLPHETVTIEGIRTALKTINSETKTQPAIVYALSTPQQLELVLVMPEGPPIHKVVPEPNAAALKETLQQFRSTLIDPTNARAYLAPAQKLYHWLIAPLEPQLKALRIDTLIFCMDAGLRVVPMAALHDGHQFLVEKYSLGSIPSVSLTDSRYKALKDAPVLAMGASQFQQLSSLPAVPVELNTITQQVRHGKSFLNEQFTFNNLKSQRQPIIHLATHANFQPGDASKDYIQLWDTQLKINQLRQMGWSKPPQVDLLVLSACRTALGDLDVELGFAGLAVQAGVKSALASLWYVDDGGTLALMSEFYHQLNQPDVNIKAEALRRAQIAMLRGESRVENGQLRVPGLHSAIPLPPELQQNQGFSHPYYWAAFTMIGSPW